MIFNNKKPIKKLFKFNFYFINLNFKNIEK